MDSDLFHHQNQPPQQIMNSGLTRYRSAPSSYFSNLMSNGVYEDEDGDPFFSPRVSSPETERILSRFIASGGDTSSSHQNIDQILENEPPLLDSMKQEHKVYSSQPQHQHQHQHQQPHMIYENLGQSQKLDHNDYPVVSRSMNDPSMAINPPTSLLRQSSSPAGFFHQLNMDKGFSVMTSKDNFIGGNGSVPDSLFSSSKRLKSPVGFSSPSSSRLLSRIPENEGKTSFHGSSWDESAILADSFLKELGESDENTFSSLDSSKNQNEGRMHAHTTLTHHLSLPTSFSEVSAMENILQFEDSVPLKSSRAKRGCATHPRSIAERVRRTRISERMKKLEQLVPNMDKQTNTADMLDLAVDYIKQLQKEVETLSDRQANCTCPHKQKL